MRLAIRWKKISEDLKKKLTEYFRPELLNRFSQIVVFKNLSREDTTAIAKLQLKSLAKNLEEQGIEFSCDEEVVCKIAELGYDPVFGARPLRGVISEINPQRFGGKNFKKRNQQRRFN